MSRLNLPVTKKSSSQFEPSEGGGGSREEQPKSITAKIRRPDAAIIDPYHRQADKLVVIREFHVPVGGYQYGFPAELLDPDEDLTAAAGRELHEEAGLDLVRDYRRNPAIFPSTGIPDEAITMVFAEVEGQPSAHNNEDSEDIDAFLIDQDAVRALLMGTDMVFGARTCLVMDVIIRMDKGYLTGECS